MSFPVQVDESRIFKSKCDRETQDRIISLSYIISRHALIINYHNIKYLNCGIA